MLLGPDSDVGRAVLAGRRERARDLLAAWQALLPARRAGRRGRAHGGPEGTPGCRSHAAHLLALADAAGIPAVLTAAVRHADPEQVRTVDLLDAARRLVVLDSRHLDRVTDAGHLADTAAMHASALEVTGGDRSRADRLVAMTALVADECTQQPAPTSASARCTCPRPRCSASPPAPTRCRCSPSAAATPSAGATPAHRGRAAGRARPARRRARRSSTPWATPPTSSPSPRSPT